VKDTPFRRVVWMMQHALAGAFLIFTAADASRQSTLLTQLRLGYGEPCTGAWIGHKGDCGSEVLTGPNGEEQKVQLLCYDTRPTKPAVTLAARGVRGKCFIPRNQPCTLDVQCQTATYCTPQGDGSICAASGLRIPVGGSETTTAESVVRLVQFLVTKLQQSIKENGVATIDGIMDTRSGVLSPYLANTILALQMLSALQRGFKAGSVMGQSPSSRSGATFVVSQGKFFLAKRIRPDEYANLAADLLAGLANHCKLREADCSAASLASCWAEAVLSCTTLNVPLLAFAHEQEHWVVLAMSGKLRGLASSQIEWQLEPWGSAAYYDVKPLWAKSNDRNGFLRTLSELEIQPEAEDAPAGLVEQWGTVSRTLTRDLLWLSQGRKDRPYIDYSVLFEVYSPQRQVPVAGRNCLSASPCFQASSAEGCHVVCVSLIDYFTSLDSFRELESLVKLDKFKDYAQKARNFLECSFADHLPSLPGMQVQGALQPGYEVLSMTATSTVPFKTGIKPSICAAYRGLACNDVRPIAMELGRGKVGADPDHGVYGLRCKFVIAKNRTAYCLRFAYELCMENRLAMQ